MDSNMISKCLSAIKCFFDNVTNNLFGKPIEEEITIRSLKAWRTDPQNKIVASKKRNLLEALSNDGLQFPNVFSEIEDADVFIAEYDPNVDEIINTTYSESAGEIASVLDDNGGIVVFD